jgi:hypothetical protein
VPLVSQQGEVSHIDHIVTIEVGWNFQMAQPVLGEKVQVQKINFAVPIQVTYRTVGLHRTD